MSNTSLSPYLEQPTYSVKGHKLSRGSTSQYTRKAQSSPPNTTLHPILLRVSTTGAFAGEERATSNCKFIPSGELGTVKARGGYVPAWARFSFSASQCVTPRTSHPILSTHVFPSVQSKISSRSIRLGQARGRMRLSLPREPNVHRTGQCVSTSSFEYVCDGSEHSDTVCRKRLSSPSSVGRLSSRRHAGSRSRRWRGSVYTLCV